MNARAASGAAAATHDFPPASTVPAAAASPTAGLPAEGGRVAGAVRSGAPVTAVACHGTMTRKGRAFFRPHGPVIMVALGDPLQLPAGPAARRTVAAAADEIHRALAAHVAATHPAPTEPERDQP